MLKTIFSIFYFIVSQWEVIVSCWTVSIKLANPYNHNQRFWPKFDTEECSPLSPQPPSFIHTHHTYKSLGRSANGFAKT